MFTATGVSENDLQANGRKVVRKNGKQVLLIAREGKVHAIANRCPHEGYPLSEGTEGPGCVLTCNWHNWKFNLETGAALVGRDPVRVYAVEIRSGEIFVDLSDPPAEAQREQALKGLDVAIRDYDTARIAREVARLIQLPIYPRESSRARVALVHAIQTTADRFEDGMTHAHGAAADWLAMSDIAKTREKRLVAVLEPIGHIAWDIQGTDVFPYAEGVSEWDEVAFLSAVEAEQEAKAIGFIRGALARDLTHSLLPTLGEAALAHYADFGHSAIYSVKTLHLIARLGDEVAEPLLLAFTRSLVRATREERLPEFRGYAGALAKWGGGDAPVRAEDFFGLSIDAALARTVESSARPVREIYDALLGAGAFNLLHFDISVDAATDNGITDNVSWLDFTHALTFANAVRHICETRPDLWPKGLLQLAMFVGRNKKYVKADQDVARWRVNDRASFMQDEMESLYDHGIVEPIIACHRVKMLFALEDEMLAVPDAPWSGEMFAAMNRWLHTPQKRHHGLRNASQALDFIAKEG